MGAYENPVTVVDTQSGQIWANAIQTLGNQASKVLDQERDRLLSLNKSFAIRLQKIQEQGVKDYDVLSGALAEANINDQQIYDQAQAFSTSKTNASIKLLQTGRPPEELAQAQKEFNESNQALKRLIPYIKAKAESTQDYLNEIGNNPVNVGEQGYASMTENQEFQIGTWIDTGFLKGSKEIIYDKEKGWGTKYKELDDKETGVDNKEFIIWGTQAANYTTTKVPTVDKTLENVLVESGVIDKNGKLTSEYQDINSEQTRVQKSKNGDITAVIVGPNWEMAALAINDRVDKLAQGYLKDPKTANAVWRNVLGEAEDLKIVKGGAIDPEQSKTFTDKLKLRAGNYIPNVDYISSDDPKAIKWVRENPGAFEIKKFGKTTIPSGNTSSKYKDLSAEESAVKIYNEFARDPLGAYNRYKQGPEDKATLVEGSIITIPQFDKEGNEQEPLRYNMDNKQERGIFFQELLNVSKLAGGDDKGRAIRLVYPSLVDSMSDKYIEEKTKKSKKKLPIIKKPI
jgi:hypothetical protein